MRGWEGFGRTGRYRQLIWIPRGPVGIALFLVVLLAVVALVAALSLVVLTLAVAAGVALAAVQVGSRLLSGARDRVDGGLGESGRRRPRVREAGPPLERYLAGVEEYDHVTTETARIDPEGADGWRARRRLDRLAGRAAALRESAIGVERVLSRERSAEAARPGIWELIVAATELQRYLYDLLAFPTTRGRAAQLRELHGLQERRDELARRRDALVRRLQETDFRGAIPNPRPLP